MARENLTQEDTLKLILAWLVLGATMLAAMYLVVSLPGVWEWVGVAAVTVVLGSIGFTTSHTNDDTDEAGNPNEFE